MKIINFLAISIAVLVLTACIKDQTTEDGSSVDTNKVQILFTIPSQVPGTYAVVETLPLEREFDEAYVIFYDQAGKYVGHVANSTQSTSSSGSFEVVKPATVELDKSYKVLVVANLKYYLDPRFSSTNDYIDNSKALTIDAMQTEMRAMSNGRISRKLPMYAQSDVTLSSSSSTISVVFERAVARFDFISNETALDVEWVKVCNYSNAGYLYHNDYNPTGSAIINGAGSSDMEENPKKVTLTRRSEMTDQLAAQSNTNGGLYAFPNINVNTGVNDQKTTCLLFKGTYSYTDKDGNPKTKEAYYRVNVCMSGKPQNLKRNNIYRITVKSVTDGGSDSEDGAMKNPTQNVNYEINDWTVDNSQGIITDSNGNYLVVSPTSAYIGGSVGSSLTGSVRVKNGSSWGVEKINPSDDWFSVSKTADGSGFILMALTDNATSGVRSSKVRVWALGTALQYEVFVYQYTQSGSEDVVLIIDGRMGDFALDIDGNGQSRKLQAILGANSANATMSFVSGDNSMIQTSDPSIGMPGAIGNNSTINLMFRANSGGEKRSAIYQITRKDGLNPDLSLKITFIQPAATQVIVPTPNTIFENGTINGFMNLIGDAYCARCQYERVYVTSRDMVKYPKWKAISSFNTFDVAIVGNSASPTTTYPETPLNETTGSSAGWFDVAVARCGPNDESLSGTITIKGCDSSGAEVENGFEYTIPLTVYSSLQDIGFVQIDTVLWHDRNIGTPMSNASEESTLTKKSLPYSNYEGDYRSADQVNYDNALFAGGLYTFPAANTPANTLCPTGWRMPKPDDIELLASQMQWAKAGYWPYIVSNAGPNKDTKGCYFPLVMDLAKGAHYWTDDGGWNRYYYYLYLSRTLSTLSELNQPGVDKSVRCLKANYLSVTESRKGSSKSR